MTLHVARWEWRTFGPVAGQAEARIRAAAFETGSLNETYILAPSDRVVARLRNGQLEARWLVETGEAGLELWRTEIKTGLPLPAQRVAELFRLWNLHPPTLTRAEYTADQFRLELVQPHAQLDTVDVTGSRVRASIQGGMAEFADLKAGGAPLKMVGVDAADSDTVRRTIVDLALSGAEPRNYLKALRGITAPGR